MTTEKTSPSLSAFLEEDREHILSELKADPSEGHAREVLSRELDRLMYRAAEADMGEPAQNMLVTARNTLPIMESVSDVEEWRRTEPAKRGQGITAACAVLLAMGAAFILLGRGTALSSILLTAGGCIELGAGAFLAGKNSRKDMPAESRASADVERKFLVDPEDAYHVLAAVTLAADHSLELERDRMLLEDSASGDLKTARRTETEFYSELLEYVYRQLRSGREAEDAREQIDYIRYYLHTMEIDVTDYSPEHAGWFELLPGGQTVTIRPALTRDGAVLRKGIASV